jgi:enamine deaminase RidA (YjgF/YER057c/UK114 family)
MTAKPAGVNAMVRPDPSQQPSTASSYARANDAERRVVRGRPAKLDAAPDEGMEAQMQRAWIDLFDAIKDAGYEKRHLVKTTVCVTEGGHLKLFRAVRDRMMRGHIAASAYLHVAGLGAPTHLVEIEGELVRGA